MRLRAPQDVLARAHGRRAAALSMMVRPVATLPMMVDRSVAALPVVSIVAAIGVGIAGSQVLAICVRVELRAVAGVVDHGLRQRGSCGDKSRGCAGQCKFLLHLQSSVEVTWERVSFPATSRFDRLL